MSTYLKNNAAAARMNDVEEARSYGRCKVWFELKGRDGLVVSDEANNLLAENADSIHLIACMGKLGTGKSYLLNALSQQPCMFGVSAGIDSFTRGVHISRNFEVHAGAAPNTKVAYLDTEGQSSSGTLYDIKLAVPVLLVSKIILFVVHCAFRPSAEDVLKPLEIFMDASRFVTRPIDRKNLYGNLHVVLLDCPHGEKACSNIIFDLENPNDANSDVEAEGMRKRNEIRNAIRVSFQSDPKVWCLPKLKEAPANYLNAEKQYLEKVDLIRDAIKHQLATPKLLGGKPLTGRMIGELVSVLKDALNSDDVSLNPPGLIAGIVQAGCERIINALFLEAKSMLEDLEMILPIAEISNYQSCVNTIESVICSKLEDELRWISSGETTINAMQQRLMNDLSPLMQACRCKNESLLASAMAAEEKRMREEAERSAQVAVEEADITRSEIARHRLDVANDENSDEQDSTQALSDGFWWKVMKFAVITYIDHSSKLSRNSIVSSAASLTKKFYKGGQFIPGGGRAPKGGIWI